VDGERGGRRVVPVEQALLQHHPRTVVALLAGLEGEGDPPGQLATTVVQGVGGPDEHGDVGVVAAGVHGVVHLGGEVEPGVLVERQGVHVGAQQEGRTGVLALEHGHDRRRGRPRW
jgi:hypothetical protein